MTSRFKLVVVDGPSRGRQLVLEPGRWTIGRDKADLRLEEDKAVSSEHAVIQVSKQRAVLRNRSSNGTWINGERGDDVILTPGDLIHIGEFHQLRVQETGAVGDVRSGTEAATGDAADPGYLGIPRRIWYRIAAVYAAAAILALYLITRPEPEEPPLRLEDASAVASAEIDDLLHRAAVYEQRGKRRSAIRVYEEILSRQQPFDSDSTATRYVLERLAVLKRGRRR